MKRPLLFLLSILLGIAVIASAQNNSVRCSPLTFYGRVNHWADSRAELTTELDLMEEMHVDGYMIELSGWGEKQWDGHWLRQTAHEYRWLLRQCRKRGLCLFVSVVNDNMGLHKYGDSGPALAEVEGAARKLVRIIRKAGAHGLFVQPVAETRTEAGVRFEQYCQDKLKDFVLVYNGEGGFPRNLPQGFRFRAVHPASITTDVPSKTFVISDHGKIIRELTVNGTLDGPADSLKLVTWVRRMWEKNVSAIGYYAFQRSLTDTVAIKIMGSN